MDMEPLIHCIFEKQTSTWQYIVACPETLQAVIIDPVLDFDTSLQSITTDSADRILETVASHNYTVVRLLETHVHADHLTAAYYLQKKLTLSQSTSVPICIGHRVRQVQSTFAQRYHLSQDESDIAFDVLFQDGELFQVGRLAVQVIHLPGHTPDHSGYQIGSNVFTGDSMFNPDVGSARCDFPNGDANVLYRSMQRLLSLPPHYKLYTGHDYPPADSGREPMPFVTVEEQRQNNKHVRTGTNEADFVKWRQERDGSLNEPRLIHQALQFNLRGGRPPRSLDGTKRTFLLMPVKVPKILQEDCCR